jgi:hypothetical protein
MILHRSENPLNYELCTDTVTVIHNNGDGTFTAKVHARAFMDNVKTQTVNKTGSSEVNSVLLVIPDDGSRVVPVAVGDKVVRGIMAAPESAEAWAQMIPARVPGMVVIRSVDPKYWGGLLVHTEAGG